MVDRNIFSGTCGKNFLKTDKILFATVSGIVTTTPEMISRIDREVPEIALITTKSYQVNPNPGNREPVIVEPEEGCYGNAVGLRNPGMIKGLKDLADLTSGNPLRVILNVSVSGNSIKEFITLVKHFEKTADIIELNLSCPHAAGGYGMAIGTDPEVVYTYIKEIKNAAKTCIFPKLTPNVDSISEIAIAAVEAGADGITAINTMGPRYYTEPHSGFPLLLNESGNKGGMSGRWIKETALEKIAEIRNAIGPDIPIIGTGGIETGRDVRNMKKAGADIIGIGSVFAAVHPTKWKAFFTTLKLDAENDTNNAKRYRTRSKKMEYTPCPITGIRDLPGDIRIIECEGKLPFMSSQFAFIWLPGIGEKPFSIMKEEPITFLIGKKGKFTSRIMEYGIGETIHVRGVYGSDSPDTKQNRILIAAGGTGIAAALKLAEKLYKQGKEVHTFHGMSLKGQELMRDDFEKWGTFFPVSDNGTAGRVLEVMIDKWKDQLHNFALYLIGPEQFMDKGAKLFTQNGGDSDNTFLSIETSTRCGVGLCGECQCNGRLTCREGTFFSWSSL